MVSLPNMRYTLAQIGIIFCRMPSKATRAPGRTVVVDARMAGYTGIGTYVRGLLRYAGDHTDDYSFDIAALTRPGSRTHESVRVRLVPAASRVFSAREQLEIPRLIAQVNARLVHVPHFNAPLLSRAPVVVTIQDCAFDRVPAERPSFLAYVYYRAMMISALRKAVRIVAPSHGTRADLLSFYGVPENKVTIIHHGIDLSAFHPRETSGAAWSAVRARLRLDIPYVLYVGLLRPRKNLATLLAAVKRLRDEFHAPFRLLIAGPADTRFLDVARDARELGISHIVTHAGFVPDDELPVLYRHAAMVVLPSLVEGFGLPIVEGMASGVPVIASDIPVHREVAGDAALLVPPLDIVGLSGAMRRLFSDHDLVTSLRSRGEERAKGFSSDTTAQRTLALYEELLSA